MYFKTLQEFGFMVLLRASAKFYDNTYYIKASAKILDKNFGTYAF